MKNLSLAFLFTCSVGYVNAQSVPPYVPTGSLMAWYSFTGNANDSSGNGNNGTVTGASLTTDRFGHANSAYLFNGTSDYIYIAPSSTLALPKEVSISAWIKCFDYSASPAQIFWHGDLASAHDPYMLYIISGDVNFRRDVGSGTTINQIGFSTSVIDTSLFHMVTGTFSLADDSMKIYFDGNLINCAYLPGTTSYAAPTYWNMIGAVNYGGQYFTGIIDDVGAWDRRLADCEISKLFFATTTLITAGPSSVTAAAGSSVHFSIADTGATGTYQWQVNSGSGFTDLVSSGYYSGVTTKILSVGPVDSTLCGHQYRCIRNAGYCIDTSNAATLSCDTTAASACGGILSEPDATAAYSGSSVTYIVSTSVVSPSYQWQQSTGSGFVNLSNIAPYSGVTTDTLTISPVSSALSGIGYRCLISNSFGCFDTTAPAPLTVRTTGIENAHVSDQVSLFPNPAKNTVTILLPTNGGSIQLLSEIGQLITEKQVVNSAVDIDISRLPTGVYIIRVQFEGNVVYKKLLKY